MKCAIFKCPGPFYIVLLYYYCSCCLCLCIWQTHLFKATYRQGKGVLPEDPYWIHARDLNLGHPRERWLSYHYTFHYNVNNVVTRCYKYIPFKAQISFNFVRILRLIFQTMHPNTTGSIMVNNAPILIRHVNTGLKRMHLKQSIGRGQE